MKNRCERNPAMIRQTGELDENQQRPLPISCQSIDRLPADFDGILHASATQLPFPRPIADMQLVHSIAIAPQLEAAMSRLEAQARGPDIEISTVIARGDPDRIIEERARLADIDLVVVACGAGVLCINIY